MNAVLSTHLATARRWWDARLPRERVLLASMVAMIAAFVIWYGLLAPLRHARQAAQVRHAQATAELLAVRADLAALAALDARLPAPPGEAAQLKSAVLESAATAGLAISRERSETDGGFGIEADEATPPQLFAFLDGLRTRHGLAPSTLSVARNGGGLRVQAGFAGTASQ
jgi:general secretion pathway protein M